MKLLNPLVDRPLPIFLIALLTVVVGFYSLSELPVRRSPSVQIPYALVVVPYIGATPENVESEITIEVEEQLAGMDELRHMTSYSSEGVSTHFLEFEDRTDMSESLREIRDKVDLAESEFPVDTEAPIVWEISLDDLPILMFTLRGGVDLYRLREIAEELEPNLETVPGVSSVETFGGFEPEVRILADPVALAQHDLTMADLSLAIRRQSRSLPAGQLRAGGTDRLIRTTGEFRSLEEIRSISVASRPLGDISLRDIARVEAKHERIISGSWHDGEPSVTLIVRRRPNVNTLETVRQLKQVVEELRPQLPPGVTIGITADSSREIGDMIRQLGTNAAVGMLFVVLVLLAVFGWRQAILVASVLPFSLLFTFIGLYVFGMGISNIALFSLILVLGLVVDGAIIMGEAIFAEQEAGASPREAARRGLARVGAPVIAADLTTIAAFVPMLLMVGIMGQFMAVMPKVVVFALLGSVFVDHLLLPATSAWLGERKRKKTGAAGRPKPHRGVTAFLARRTPAWIDAYEGALGRALGRRRWVIVSATLAFVGAMLLFGLGAIETIFLPRTDHSRFSLSYALPVGTSLEETNRVGQLLTRELEGIPEIRSYVLTTGDTGALKSETGERGRYGPEYGKLTIELAPRRERERDEAEVVEDLRARMLKYAAVEIAVERMQEGPSVGAALALQLRGKDLAELSSVADEVKSRLAGLEGTRDARVDYDPSKPEIRVEVDRARAAAGYGIVPEQVSAALHTAFRGLEVGRMWLSEQRVDIRLQAPDSYAYTLDGVREIPLRSGDGAIVPLGEIAQVSLGSSHKSIIRRDSLRSVTVRADAAPGVSTIALEQEARAVLADLSLPPGMRMQFSGESEERDRSYTSILSALKWAFLLIYFIIAIQFNSLLQPAIVLATIPLAMVGVTGGLLVTSTPFSFLVFVGVVSLTGIVVNDGIVLIDAINRARRSGLDLDEAIRQAARSRLRPVLLTTVTTIAGLLPLTAGVAHGGDFWAPLGVTIISGLAVASVLTLFVVPVLYSLLESSRMGRRGRALEGLGVASDAGGPVGAHPADRVEQPF